MKDISEIHDCIERSRLAMEKMCEERVSAIEQFVGQHYGDNGAKKAVPANLLELATTIYLRLLAARSPRCTITTDETALKPFAADMEIVLNQIPDEIGLGDTIRRAVMEAMFSMGIVKVGVAGFDPRPNFGDEPFVSLVQISDYFVDMSARSWDEIQYEGNEYWMSVEDVRDFYGVELPGEDDSGYSDQGVKQPRAISNNNTGAELYRRVRLRDVYFVRKNRLVTYAVDSHQIIRDIEWDGPEGTPYIKLWFSEVPGNLLPLPPMAVWRDLHDFSNMLYRKVANQSMARKTVVLFQGGNDEEVARFRDAADGEAIKYTGAAPKEVSVGGLDQAALALFLQNNEMMSRFAGNLDSLGGLSPSASTAKQDKLINESASARIAAMGEQTVDFAKKIFRRLAWYLWTDPVRVRKFRKVGSQKFNVGVNKIWTPETRDGKFLDYNFDIAVFSMQDDSPTTRIQKLSEVMQGFVFPMLQQLTEQGAFIDMRMLMDYISENANMPQLKDLVRFIDGQQESVGESSQLPQPEYVSTKSPFSHRVYERVSRPGKMTERGRSATLMTMLMGKGAQPADIAGAVGANTMQ